MNNIKQDLENTIQMLEDYESEYFLKVSPLTCASNFIDEVIELLSLIENKGLTLELQLTSELYIKLSNQLFKELSWIRYLPFKFEKLNKLN